MHTLLSLQWMSRWGRPVGGAALGLAGLLLAGALLHGWTLWGQLSVKTPLPIEVGSPAATPSVALQKPVADWHLFGRQAAGDTAGLPETHLQLVLTGILTDTGSGAMAIVATPGQRGQVVRVGDRLASGVRVSAITSEAVVIQNGERLERLVLQRSPLQFRDRPESMLGG